MKTERIFSFGYGPHNKMCWHLGMNDTLHEYWWQPTLGMDGVS